MTKFKLMVSCIDKGTYTWASPRLMKCFGMSPVLHFSMDEANVNFCAVSFMPIA